jgi:hypothetical protein
VILIHCLDSGIVTHPPIPARGPHGPQPPNVAPGSCRDEAGPSTSHTRHDNDDEDGPGPLNTAGLVGIDPWIEEQGGGPSSETAKDGGQGTSDNDKGKEPAHDSDMLSDHYYDQLQPAEYELSLPTYDPIFPPPTLPNDLELLQPFYQLVQDPPPILPAYASLKPLPAPLIGWTASPPSPVTAEGT